MKNIFLVVLFFWLTSAHLAAQETVTPIRFDFNHADELSEWRLGGFPGGGRDIIDGSFVISAPTNAGASSLFDIDHSDLFVESQIRFLEDHPRVDWGSLSIRDLEIGNGVDGYFGAVSSTGDLLLARLLPGVGVDPVVQAAASGFDALDEDLKMRLVADGSSIDLFAWPATESMPPEPQLSIEDDRYSAGSFIALGNTSYAPVGSASPVAFRYVQISPVPEPNTGMLAFVGFIAFVLRLRGSGRSRHGSVR